MALARCLTLVAQANGAAFMLQANGAAFMLHWFVSPAGVVHHAQHCAAEIAPA